MGTADIRPTTDVVQVIDGAVRQGLRDQGFAPVEYSKTTPRSLVVEVRDLSHDTSGGFFTAGIQTRATLKARASRRAGLPVGEGGAGAGCTDGSSGAAQINHVLSG